MNAKKAFADQTIAQNPSQADTLRGSYYPLFCNIYNSQYKPQWGSDPYYDPICNTQ
jgi:hypothetical protein